MFEQLINEAASRFNLSTGAVSGLVRGLLSLMTDLRTGGVDGFVGQFRRAGLGDVVTSWFGGKDVNPLTASQVESALGTTALGNLGTSTGLPRSVVSSVVAFLLPTMIGRLTPNGVLPSTSSLLSQVSSYLAGPAPAAVEQDQRETRGRWPRWLPWAAAALVALGAWWLLRGPTGTIDPQLTLTNRDGKVTYSGVVRDQATETAIVNGLRTTFGAGNIDGHLRIDPNVKRIGWLPRLSDLLAALKTPGVDFSLTGDTIRFGGWLSAADRQALTDRFRGIFGTPATIGSLGDVAVEAVRAANDKAMSALGAIGSAVSPEAAVRAMNLAIINFPSGSAQIPAESAEIIRKSAEVIRRAPAGSIIEIAGHTDNTGNAASNLALSQSRAEAVKTALVDAGVPASMLVAKGYGDSSPRATNDTEYGRFQNRRIEYAVVASRQQQARAK